jgi:uncharacterized MAPEG superfamily protein
MVPTATAMMMCVLLLITLLLLCMEIKSTRGGERKSVVFTCERCCV